MPWYAELLIGFVFSCGLLGILVPFLPGIVLVWSAMLAWTIFDGGGSTRWTLFGISTVLLIAGLAAHTVIPATTVKTASAAPTKRTLAIAAIFAIIGFFVIPIIGMPIGFAVGVFFANYMFDHNVDRSWSSTVSTVKSFGWAIIAQFICGFLIVVMWVIGLAQT